MTTSRLTTPAQLELAKLFEASAKPLTTLAGSRLNGVAAWELDKVTPGASALLQAWTECVGYTDHLPVPVDDQWVMVDVWASPDPQYFEYRSPETYQTCRVLRTRLAIHAFKTQAFLHNLADLLDIDPRRRGGIASSQLGDKLWCLGQARIGAALVDVWYARGLTGALREVMQHFLAHHLPEQGLVLSGGLPLPDTIRTPRHYRFVPLSQALSPGLAHAVPDLPLLKRVLQAPAHAPQEPSAPVYFDPQTSTLSILTRPVPPWVIKGARQPAAVAFMVAQLHLGRRVLAALEILKAAYKGVGVPPGMTMARLFSGNQQWRAYIDNPTKGAFQLRLD